MEVKYYNVVQREIGDVGWGMKYEDRDFICLHIERIRHKKKGEIQISRRVVTDPHHPIIIEKKTLKCKKTKDKRQETNPPNPHP